MSRVVFVLGAGASKDAGVPVMNDFLDTAESLNYAVRDPDSDAVFEALVELRAANAICKINLRNIESVFSAFEIARRLGRLGRLPKEKLDQLPDQMRRLILKTIERTMMFQLPPHSHLALPPVPYGQFEALLRDLVEKKRSSGRSELGHASVLTFNYDLGVDYALFQSPLSYSYGFSSHSVHIPLLKLHGSLNWGHCECGEVHPIELKEFFLRQSWPPHIDVPTSVTLDFSNKLKGFEHCQGKPITPLIVPPTWSKGEHHAKIAPVWRRAAKELSEANTIIICGYSLPETDVFFHYLVGIATIGVPHLKRFWVFDPNEEVRLRYESFLGEHALQRFQFHPMTFKRAIAFMKQQIDDKW